MTTAPRRLGIERAAAYRALAIEGYGAHPDAFTSSVGERAALPLAWWQQRLTTNAVFAVFDGDALAGVAGCEFASRERTAHKANLFGMYVSEAQRRRGHARALVHAVIDHARQRPGVLLAQLMVADGNAPALRLYESCGFTVYGTEPMAVRVGERFIARQLMWRDLRP